MQKYFIQNVFAEHNSNSNHQVQEIKIFSKQVLFIIKAKYLCSNSTLSSCIQTWSTVHMRPKAITLYIDLSSAVQFTYKKTASRSTSFRLTDFKSSHKTPSLKVVETKHSLRPPLRMFMILSNHIPSP